MPRELVPRRFSCVATAIAILASGCTTMRQVELRTPAGSTAATLSVEPGDTVRASLRDGRTARFVVAA